MKISNFKFQISNSQKGLTYIELILYLAIVSIVLAAVIPFAWNIILGSTKSSVEQEVYGNARLVSERIKYEIRNATGINTVSATQISLQTENVANNPTVIRLVNGRVTIKQGTQAETNLHSNNTNFTSFQFIDYSSLDNKTKHIGFTFTMRSLYNSTRQEYQEQITMRGSAEVLSN